MSLKPKEDIGMEVHPDNDQFFRFEHGQGKCIIDDNEYRIESGTALIIPAGAKHNIMNTSEAEELKMYTLYSPPHHKDGIIREDNNHGISNHGSLKHEIGCVNFCTNRGSL